MNVKDLKIEFRYLVGNIACMSIDSIAGKPIHNDINNEDAIKMFNALIGSKENSILEENRQLQNNWNELKKFVEKDVGRWEQEEQKWIEQGFMKFGGEANNKIIFKKVLNKMNELEGKNNNEEESNSK